MYPKAVALSRPHVDHGIWIQRPTYEPSLSLEKQVPYKFYRDGRFTYVDSSSIWNGVNSIV